MAGLNQSEVMMQMDLLRSINAGGLTMIVVEHVMKAIMAISDVILVLHHGRKIEFAPPNEVARIRKSSGHILGRAMLSRPEATSSALLAVAGIQAGYRGVQVIWDVTLEIGRGEVVALVGSNGAGKTTLLRTLSGVLPLWSGSVSFEGRSLSGKSSHVLVAAGIAHVPEGRRLFAGLTVKQTSGLALSFAKPVLTWNTILSASTLSSLNSRSGGINLRERSAEDSSRWWRSVVD